VAARGGAAAPEALEGPRPAAHACAAHRDAHPAEPQAVGPRAPADGVADGDVARRDAGRDALPLRAAARAARPRAEEWLLIEWPRGDAEPTKYWLSTLPATMALAELSRLAKLRWRIERDYQELKDELGLDHFEGRGWRGFHHHGALCIAAYAFLAAERARLSPPEPLAFLRAPRLPKGFKPRGAPGAA
jgi:DDE family transposase